MSSAPAPASTLSAASLARLAPSAGGLAFRAGPFVYRLKSDVPAVAEGLESLYAGFPLVGKDAFVDFEVEILRSRGWRRFVRTQSQFRFEGTQSFEPLPLAHGFALMEWALNWCVSSHVNHYLLIHAAVVERGGRAVVLPAPPGSGKSTLCAALVQRGWRLLSDEIAVVSLGGTQQAPRLWPIVRPVSLKNHSIEVIRAFEPRARLSRLAHGTAKGTVAHMRPPDEHIARMDESAPAAWVVFPRWRLGAEANLKPRTRAGTAVELARNSFNYPTLGLTGFDRLTALVDACACFDFEYGRLDDAIATFDALTGNRA